MRATSGGSHAGACVGRKTGAGSAIEGGGDGEKKEGGREGEHRVKK